ncbi:MAG: hypothetical protein ACK4MS_08290 [Paracoccaceae bacterium]
MGWLRRWDRYIEGKNTLILHVATYLGVVLAWDSFFTAFCGSFTKKDIVWGTAALLVALIGSLAVSDAFRYPFSLWRDAKVSLRAELLYRCFPVVLIAISSFLFARAFQKGSGILFLFCASASQ